LDITTFLARTDETLENVLLEKGEPNVTISSPVYLSALPPRLLDS